MLQQAVATVTSPKQVIGGVSQQNTIPSKNQDMFDKERKISTIQQTDTMQTNLVSSQCAKDGQKTGIEGHQYCGSNNAQPIEQQQPKVICNASSVENDWGQSSGQNSIHKTVMSQQNKSKTVATISNSHPDLDCSNQIQSKPQSSSIIATPTVPKRAKAAKAKLWKDQRDYDDEESWGEGLASFSWEEEDQEGDQHSNEGDSEDSVEQICQRKNKNKNCRAKVNQTATANSSLNHNAPVFVPRNNAKAVSSTERTPKFDRNDTIHDRQLKPAETSVGAQMSTLLPSDDINTVARSQARQLVTIDSVISTEERQLLEAMADTETNKFLNEDIGRHFFEGGEEEQMLSHCRAQAARNGDLSPMHSKANKIACERERICDGRMGVDANIRRPLMRVAKQKQAVQPSVLKPSRARNKREG